MSNISLMRFFLLVLSLAHAMAFSAQTRRLHSLPLTTLSTNVNVAAQQLTLPKKYLNRYKQLIRSRPTNPFSGFLPCPTLASLHYTLSWRSIKSIVKRSWWTSPLLLCVVPLYTSLLFKAPPTTPSWWKLTNLESILSHSTLAPSSPLSSSSSFLSTSSSIFHSSLTALFLASNICYFFAGIYLLRKYPFVRRNQTTMSNQQSISALSRASSLLPRYIPSRATWLSLWLLLAGSVSALFHAVQTYGEYSIAEGWCYLDHGIAISATLYFLHYCQKPSIRTQVVGGIGFILLAVPLPGYLYLHSLWHALSAGAAVLWALQPSVRRRARLEQSLLMMRQGPDFVCATESL